MGCDIHDYLEVRRDGRWEYAGDNAFPGNEYDSEKHSPFDGQRDYDLFGFLADVRNSGVIAPISEPRGLPSDVSAEVAKLSDEDYLHSRSWLTLAELLNHDYDQTATSRYGEPGSLRDVLGEWYFGRLELMKAFGKPEDVRIVFWFGN